MSHSQIKEYSIYARDQKTFWINFLKWIVKIVNKNYHSDKALKNSWKVNFPHGKSPADLFASGLLFYLSKKTNQSLITHWRSQPVTIKTNNPILICINNTQPKKSKVADVEKQYTIIYQYQHRCNHQNGHILLREIVALIINNAIENEGLYSPTKVLPYPKKGLAYPVADTINCTNAVEAYIRSCLSNEKNRYFIRQNINTKYGDDNHDHRKNIFLSGFFRENKIDIKDVQKIIAEYINDDTLAIP